jgi:hypothetical protein
MRECLVNIHSSNQACVIVLVKGDAGREQIRRVASWRVEARFALAAFVPSCLGLVCERKKFEAANPWPLISFLAHYFFASSL